MNIICRLVILPWIVALGFATDVASAARNAGPWDLAELKKVPAHAWGARTGLVQEVFYQGEPLQGKPTRVFAYLGRPAEGQGPFPAMVLVHGGGGKAFRDWAAHWAQCGYAAIAMDLSGNGPAGRLPDGGPDQSDTVKFRDFTEADVKEMWSYHAVAAVLLGHSLLASLPEVDRSRVGITGISWGGYLTCIVAGLDDRLKVAVPVYGCGFLGNNSVWTKGSLAAMSPEARARWLRLFDPSQYLGGVNCPILFLNGSNDFAYPLDSYQKSYRLVPERWRTVSVVIKLPHGHIWNFGEVDAFVDSALRGGAPLPRLQPLKVRGGTASTAVKPRLELKKAELHYTADTGAWQQRNWQTVPAELKDGAVSAPLPDTRPLTFYESVTDARGLRVSTEHVELPGTP